MKRRSRNILLTAQRSPAHPCVAPACDARIASAFDALTLPHRCCDYEHPFLEGALHENDVQDQRIRHFLRFQQGQNISRSKMMQVLTYYAVLVAHRGAPVSRLGVSYKGIRAPIPISMLT
jgi:hypothetical protein